MSRSLGQHVTFRLYMTFGRTGQKWKILQSSNYIRSAVVVICCTVWAHHLVVITLLRCGSIDGGTALITIKITIAKERNSIEQWLNHGGRLSRQWHDWLRPGYYQPHRHLSIQMTRVILQRSHTRVTGHVSFSSASRVALCESSEPFTHKNCPFWPTWIHIMSHKTRDHPPRWHFVILAFCPVALLPGT